MTSSSAPNSASGSPAESVDSELTVLFVDLVRFTSLTDVHGDIAGADAADALESVVRSRLVDGSRLVKTLGDGVLVTTQRPTAALELAAGIVQGLHDLAMGFDARGGVHHGPVVERKGDVFGSTVNLAAKVATLAQPGRIVVTRVVAEAVGSLQVGVTPLGERTVSGFVDPVELFEIDPCEHDGVWITDPVCGMRLTPEQAIGRRAHKNGEIGFCSVRCAAIFDRSPRQFL